VLLLETRNSPVILFSPLLGLKKHIKCRNSHEATYFPLTWAGESSLDYFESLCALYLSIFWYSLCPLSLKLQLVNLSLGDSPSPQLTCISRCSDLFNCSLTHQYCMIFPPPFPLLYTPTKHVSSYGAPYAHSFW
jgi:hypothetical protein